MNFRRSISVLIALFVLLPATASAGTIVADTGFRPAPDGFSFPNYGDEEGYRNLDATEMQRLFGPAVCLAGKGAKCVLTPPARAWMEEGNRAMADGHCFGFATLSELIHDGSLPRFGFRRLSQLGAGATTPFELLIPDNKRLQSAIARAFVYQMLPAVADQSVYGTPSGVLRVLIALMNKPGEEPATLTIHQRDGENGHAITPYAVEDMGNGLYDIHVYDNNWPGNTSRRVHVDTRTDAWSYYGAINPGDPEAVYEGDAKTETLGLAPTRVGLGTHPCFFCIGRQGQRSKYNEIRLSGSADSHADLLVIDPKGRKTGVVGGRIVNRIPGAKVARRTSGARPSANGELLYADSPVPIVRVPKRIGFRVRIDGRRLKFVDRETLTLVGPTYDATVENLVMAPGQVAELALSRDGQALGYGGSRLTRVPAVSFGAESKRTASRVTVTAVGAPRGSAMTFVERPKRKLMWIGDRTARKRTYRLAIERYDSKGPAPTLQRTVTIAGQQRAYLYYGPLARPNGVPKIVVVGPGGKAVRVLPVLRGTS